MNVSRRSFFAKVAGAAVGVRAAGPLARAAARFTAGGYVYGSTGPAIIGLLHGSERVIPIAEHQVIFDEWHAHRTVTIHIDGKELARATAVHMSEPIRGGRG